DHAPDDARQHPTREREARERVRHEDGAMADDGIARGFLVARGRHEGVEPAPPQNIPDAGQRAEGGEGDDDVRDPNRARRRGNFRIHDAEVEEGQDGAEEATQEDGQTERAPRQRRGGHRQDSSSRNGSALPGWGRQGRAPEERLTSSSSWPPSSSSPSCHLPPTPRVPRLARSVATLRAALERCQEENTL